MITNDSFDFSFDPTACESCGGKCCLGESGHIIISESEISRMAEVLQLPVHKLRQKYLIKTEQGFSIREVHLDNGQFACIYFDLEKKCCSVYDARPVQCRTFPFWDRYFFKKDETFYNCPGICSPEY